MFIKHKPNYSILRVFGYACYPSFGPYSQHELKTRTKTCVILEYSLNNKGYRCLDFDAGCIYLSRRVVFDENFFPSGHLYIFTTVLSKISSSKYIDNALFSFPFYTWLQSSSHRVTSQPFILGPYPISPILMAPTHTPTPVPCHPHFFFSLLILILLLLFLLSLILLLLILLLCSYFYFFSYNFHPSTVEPSSFPSPNAQTHVPHSAPNSTSSVLPSHSSLSNIVPTSTTLNVHPMQTHSQYGISKKNIFLSTKHSPSLPTHEYYHNSEPICYTEASKFTEWRAAMSNEFSALQ